MLYETKKLGWTLLGVRMIPYFNPKPLLKSGFEFTLLSPYQTTIDVFLFKKIDFPDKITSIYM